MTRAWPPLVSMSMAPTPQTLVRSGSTVAVDCSLGLHCELTVDANVTVSNPTNAAKGDTLTIIFTQNGTGGYWVDFGSAFEKPAVATRADDVTTHRWVYDGTVWRVVSREVAYRLGSATSDSVGTGVVVTGSGFVPVPSAVYLWETDASCTTATTTTGAQPGVEAGTNNTGSVVAMGRSSVSVGVFSIANTPAGSPVYLAQTTMGAATPAQRVLMKGSLNGGATSPGTWQLYLRTEIASSQVTISADTLVRMRRVA